MFIKTTFPLDKIQSMDDKGIKEKIERLSYLTNLLDCDDLSHTEILTEILKGMSQSVMPNIVKKYPDYNFLINIINKNNIIINKEIY